MFQNSDPCSLLVKGLWPKRVEPHLMRILRIAQSLRQYPRYIAEMREGRFKGKYPDPAFAHVPSLRRQWDRGGFGTGSRLNEVEADSPSALLEKLRAMGINPQHDEIDFYEIRAQGSQRARIQRQRLFDMVSDQRQ